MENRNDKAACRWADVRLNCISYKTQKGKEGEGELEREGGKDKQSSFSEERGHEQRACSEDVCDQHPKRHSQLITKEMLVLDVC